MTSCLPGFADPRFADIAIRNWAADHRLRTVEIDYFERTVRYYKETKIMYLGKKASKYVRSFEGKDGDFISNINKYCLNGRNT